MALNIKCRAEALMQEIVRPMQIHHSIAVHPLPTLLQV